MNRKRNPGNSRRQKSELAKNHSAALIEKVSDNEIGGGIAEPASTSDEPAGDYEYEENVRKSKCDKCKHNCDEICSKYNECCNFTCASDKELLIRIICLLIDKEYGLKAIEQKMRKSELNNDLKNIKSISDLLERAVVGLGETAVSAVKKAVDAAGTMTDITSGLAKIAAGAAGTAGSTAMTASGLASVAQGAAGTAGAAAFTTYGLANTVAGTAGTAAAVASTAGAAADIAAETAGVAAAGAVTTGAAVDIAAETVGVAAAGAISTGAAVDIAAEASGLAAAGAGTAGAAGDVAIEAAGLAAAGAATIGSAADVVAQEAGIAAAVSSTKASIADVVAGEAATAAAISGTKASIANVVAGEAATAAAVSGTKASIADVVSAEAATAAAISNTKASIANMVAGEAATAAAVSGTKASIANVVAGEAATAAAVSGTKASIAQAAEDASVSREDDIHTEVVTTGPVTLDTDEDFIQVWVVNNNNVPTKVISVIMYNLTVNSKPDRYVQSSAARANSSVLFTITPVPAICEIQIQGLTRNIFAYAVALKKTDSSSKLQAPVEARILCTYP